MIHRRQVRIFLQKIREWRRISFDIQTSSIPNSKESDNERRDEIYQDQERKLYTGKDSGRKVCKS